jgi:DNA polymerase II large subunit
LKAGSLAVTSRNGDHLRVQFDQLHELAGLARSKGLDPALEPECRVAKDVAERVEKSVGPSGIATRIRELSSMIPREEVAIKIAEEIALARFASEGESAAEQAIRTAAAILDEGVTAAPLQGINTVKVKNNPDKTKYLALYFAGPIRSAGGTEMGLTVVVADYVRQIVGLDRYKATEIEAKRFVEELRLYEREVARFQYKVPDEELFNSIMKLPVEITGVETDPVEVASYRNVPRIETNRVRGGALRVVNDGLLGRSQKILKIVERLDLLGWDWLRDLRQPSAEADEVKELMFMEDVVAGRPIFSFPGFFGGFRLRYGRTRATGMAAVGIHPATMVALDDFPATGTQLRIERPGKAGIVTPVDTIEPPIVKLTDGSVVRLDTAEQARQVQKSIQSVLFLGDLLISFGEFLENNRPLSSPGFTEEWWAQLLKNRIELGFQTLSEAELACGISKGRLISLVRDPLRSHPSARECLLISQRLGVPLHPRYTWFWERLSADDWAYLRERLGSYLDPSEAASNRIVSSFEQRLKTLLETLCIPHTVKDGGLSFGEETVVLAACLAVGKRAPERIGKNALEAAQVAAACPIFPKGGTFIGARMGRPEKAKRREMRPITHCLFPLGLAGGARRNVVEAAKSRSIVETELIRRRCRTCRELTHQASCPKCGNRTEIEMVCPKCGRTVAQDQCPVCGMSARSYERTTISVSEAWSAASKKLRLREEPDVVKGVKGLMSGSRCPEPLEKGILRARYDLSMFKDGTVRFDATNAPLTHFRPAEIGVKVDRLRELGYDTDIDGTPLEKSDQVVPIETQDIIVSDSCADYLVRVANFIDDLLTRFYGLPSFYHIRTRDDLVGHLVIGLSPHTSVGIVGRIIGFTKARVCFAHPFWHASKRRDCDGDEDSVTLALDVLVNFSKSFLPSRIGGIMDAPLLLTVVMNPSEVARQAFNLETIHTFPARFFEEASRNADPKTVSDLIEVAVHRLGTERIVQSIGFTHEIGDINTGTHESAYTQLPTMVEKMGAQLALAEKIRAVEAADVARRVLSTHLMRDLIGNLRAFSTQRTRCMKCNAKFRRPPLRGVCPRCGGKIAMTVYRGTIEKYLELARDLVRRYDLGTYNAQRLLLLQEELRSLFRAESEGEQQKNQPALADFI